MSTTTELQNPILQVKQQVNHVRCTARETFNNDPVVQSAKQELQNELDRIHQERQNDPFVQEDEKYKGAIWQQYHQEARNLQEQRRSKDVRDTNSREYYAICSEHDKQMEKIDKVRTIALLEYEVAHPDIVEGQKSAYQRAENANSAANATYHRQTHEQEQVWRNTVQDALNASCKEAGLNPNEFSFTELYVSHTSDSWGWDEW